MVVRALKRSFNDLLIQLGISSEEYGTLGQAIKKGVKRELTL